MAAPLTLGELALDSGAKSATMEGWTKSERESRRMASDGTAPVLKKPRWLLLEREENLKTKRCSGYAICSATI